LRIVASPASPRLEPLLDDNGEVVRPSGYDLGSELYQAISLLQGLLEKPKPKVEEDNLTTEEDDWDNISF